MGFELEAALELIMVIVAVLSVIVVGLLFSRK